MILKVRKYYPLDEILREKGGFLEIFERKNEENCLFRTKVIAF